MYTRFRVSPPNQLGRFPRTRGKSRPYSISLGRQYPNVAYQQINPKLWQKTVWQFHDRVEKAGKLDTKKTSLNCAKRLWPGADLRKSDKCKTWHDGMVDAALIAESCRRTFSSERLNNTYELFILFQR